MAVTKAQHVAHSNMISSVAKFFGPKTANASGSTVKFSQPKVSSTIPGVGQSMPKSSSRSGSSSFGFATKQSTFGVPGAQ